MVKFKDIAQYYLGTGLEVTYRLSDVINTHKDELRNKALTCDSLTFCITYGKPILRSLDSLTKPITVKGYNDGKEFVPLYQLIKEDKAFTIDFIDVYGYEELKFSIVELLLKWHFNIFNLEETEYIKID